MIGPDDERELVEACRQGDSAAFGVLVRRYQDRLYPTLLRLTGHAEDAQDLSQEAFFRAYQKIHRFHGESSFYTWLYRLAVNLALSDRRRHRNRPRAGRRREASGDQETSAAVEVGQFNDPAEPIERAERIERVQTALNHLAPDHRAVVVMKDLDGLRYEEIAEILEIPIGTVRSRLHRARLELRGYLQEQADEHQQPIRGQFQ